MKDNRYAFAAEIILPAGSTGADLQSAINGASSGDMITISGDMPFIDTVTIPEGIEITIQSGMGNNYSLIQSNMQKRHFSVAGSLILKDITLDGMHSEAVSGGGGIYASGGSLLIDEGVTIQNCYSRESGGAVYLSNSTFTMAAGAIITSVSGNGGGIYLTNSDFTMLAGTISSNISGSYGGGISIVSYSSFVMAGGIISGNIAESSGGGFYVSDSSSLIIYEGIISGNAASYGGGAYINYSHSDIDDCIISGNAAIYGGGIYIRFSAYEGLNTSVNTAFRCNRASSAYKPPEDAGASYPNIQFSSVTITSHPLNNYDINYSLGEVIDAKFHLIYNANGGIGSHTGPGIEPCETDKALTAEETGISRYGYTFTDWNTAPDGSGYTYAPEDEINVSGDITLYAQWSANLYKAAYNANGGRGGYVESIEYDSLYTVLSSQESGVSRMMYILVCWNTEPDGNGTTYMAGDVFTVSGDITLYAQWKKITRSDAVNLILLSAAMEELAAANILHEEGERLQCILEASEGRGPGYITVCDIMTANEGVQKILGDVIKTKILLKFKLDRLEGYLDA